MNTLKTDMKHAFIRFFKNETLTYMYALSILAIIAKFLTSMKRISSSDGFDVYVMPLVTCLEMVKYLFVFFLFLTFEYFYMLKSASLEETVGGISNGIRRYENGSLSVCVIGAFVYWGMIALLNMAGSIFLGNKDMAYMLQSSFTLFVFVFGNLLLASLLAWVTSKYFGRIMSYFILVGMVLFSSFYFEEISAMLLGMGVNIYPFQELFTIMPTGLRWMPNFQNPFVVQPKQMALIATWILGLYTLAKMHRNFEQKRSRVYWISGFVCMIAACIFCAPSSNILMNENPEGTVMESQMYYGNDTGSREADFEKFEAVSYKMEMMINTRLKNSVEIEVTPCNLDCYAFTLYHGFQVKRVSDQNGKKLRFSQVEDALYIYNDDSEDISLLNIYYKGGSSTYYSNALAIYLPGDFPYYPQPGIHDVYDRERYGYQSDFLEKDAYFEVNISGHSNIYSNLDSTKKGSYKGYCRGPIFLKGFLKKYDYRDVTVTYPYLNKEFSEETIKKWIDTLKDGLGVSCPDKIFFQPSVNQPKVIHKGDDYIIAPYIFDSDEYTDEGME
ncbi:MAG: hypothetical protein NC225_08940 [Clostridium sp.]|nr:hypothetical protein [Clostridium sp.]MCM1399587.1 hypothetical protein [Clostridium sp.]MCM1460141.1 hypothetical protein [Bacteroides sp.]